MMRWVPGLGFLLCVLAAACGGDATEPESAGQSLPPAGTPGTAVAGSAQGVAPSLRNAVSTPVASPVAGRSSMAANAPASSSGAGAGSAGSTDAAGATPPVMGTGMGMGGAGEGAGAAGTDHSMMQASAAGTGVAQPSAKPMGPLIPPNGAGDICPDVSLHLRFEGEPSLGFGQVAVFETGSSQPVASVDVSTGQTRETVGGTELVFVQPVFVVDHEVIVHLPAPLAYGKSYSVRVDSGAIRGSGGPSLNGDGSEWQFSTRAAPPADMSQLRVALDGTGDFCAVQSALETAPEGATISVGAGYYHELIHVSGKSNVTLRGDDRQATVILGINNERLNGGTAKRSLVNIEKSSGLTIERLTIHNLTEQGGSQAEALRLQDCDKCVVRDADILSLQDTLLWSGRIYAKDCYIAGNVDFVWGKGAVYFDGCEIKTVGRKGYVVQSRNAPGESGYVFVDSKITADPGVTGIVLARIDVGVYPGSHVAYVNCQMGDHIAPEGWTITGGIGGSALRFWEYQSTDAAGKPLDVSRRHASSRQITADEAASMRDPANVLGGWTPP